MDGCLPSYLLAQKNRCLFFFFSEKIACAHYFLRILSLLIKTNNIHSTNVPSKKLLHNFLRYIYVIIYPFTLMDKQKTGHMSVILLWFFNYMTGSKEIAATALLMILFIWRDASKTTRARTCRRDRIKNNLVSPHKIKESWLSSPNVVVCTSFSYLSCCCAFVFQEYSTYNPFVHL